MLTLVAGFVLGAVCLLVLELVWLFYPGNPTVDTLEPSETPFRIPHELKQLLLSPGCSDSLKKKESCVAINLLLQFIFQELRNTGNVKRFVVQRLQNEFNEVLGRFAAGKFLKDLRLKQFSLGAQLPVIKSMQVGQVKLSTDQELFEELDVLMDVDYRGEFQFSVDIITIMGHEASLAVKLKKLSGHARLQLQRNPFTHWSFSFVQDPVIDLDIKSKFESRPLPQLVPLIVNQFRRSFRKRHVLPAYKVRFEPILQNPLMTPIGKPEEGGRFKFGGCLVISSIYCSRLNISVVPVNHSEVYVSFSTGMNPVSFSGKSDSSIVIAVKIRKKAESEDFGMTFRKSSAVLRRSARGVVIEDVEHGSLADKSGMVAGDILLAVNRVPVTSEKQALKVLSDLGAGDDFSILLQRFNNQTEVLQRAADGTTKTTVIDDRPSAAASSLGETTTSGLGKDEQVHDEQPSSSFESRGQPPTAATISGLHRAHSDPELDNVDQKATAASFVEPIIEPRRMDTMPRPSPAHSRKLAVSCMRKVSSVPNAGDKLQKRAGECLLAERSKALRSRLNRVRSISEHDDSLLVHFMPSRGTDDEGSETDGTEKVSFQFQKPPTSEDNEETAPIAMLRHNSNVGDGINLKANADDEAAGENAPVEDLAAAATGVKSKPVDISATPMWDESFVLPLTENDYYLSVCLHTKQAASSASDSGGDSSLDSDSLEAPFAHLSLFIPDILDSCSLTESKIHFETFYLVPVGVPRLPPNYRSLSCQSGFEPRLCYGDISLEFQWYADRTYEELTSEVAKATIDQKFETLTPQEAENLHDDHEWVSAKFQSPTLCYVCLKNIWLKSALQCTKCSMISHKKCLAKAAKLGRCSRVSESAAIDSASDSFESSNASAVVEEGIEASTAYPLNVAVASGQKLTKAQKVHSVLSERLSILRRRRLGGWSTREAKAAPEITAAIEGAGPGVEAEASGLTCTSDRQAVKVAENGTIFDELGLMLEDGNEASGSGLRSILYTKGGTYNEYVIHAAKNMGKELFSNLPLVERKAKIDAQIDRLQKEIDMATVLRLSLIQKVKASQGGEIPVKEKEELLKIDDKLQSLAVLMLHYCAGLQNCIDSEEAAANSSPSSAQHSPTAERQP